MTNLDETIMNEMEYSTFVNIISNIPSCIFFKDQQLKYRFSSHCWAQLISDDIVGKTDLDIRKDKDNALKAMEADREILRTKKGCKYTIKSDIDGEVSYLELIKEPIIDKTGEAIGIVGLINDVTQKVVMQKQIMEMSDKLEMQCHELEESNEELSSALEQLKKLHVAHKLFTASMNHELRSPLNGIIGLLQLLLEDKNLNIEQRNNVYNAYQSSQLMINIVNELLDFARMEVDEFQIKQEVFSLRDAVDNVIFVTRNQAAVKNLEFIVEVQEGIPDQFIGDEIRLKQIMFNFASNAVKYTDAGSVCLMISYQKEQLSITCADTGQGMDEAALTSLFDPYVRFNESKNKNIKGTGLGLSIVKKIIDKMGGTVVVQSKLNEGSTFTATIPLKEYADLQKQDRKKDYSQLSVLCVDDIEVTMVVLTMILKHIGIKADQAGSGREAIEMASKKQYDLIFLDHMMPQMDGIETFHVIRTQCLMNQSTPVVMLTGNDDEETFKLYQKEGLDGYLVKPASKDRLVEVIERYI